MLIHLRATWRDHYGKKTPVDMSALIREDSVYGKRVVNVIFASTANRVSLQFEFVAKLPATEVTQIMNNYGIIHSGYGAYTIDKEDRALLQTMLDSYELGL